MFALTKLEAVFVLDVLKECSNPDTEMYSEELEQAIEILEELLRHDNTSTIS